MKKLLILITLISFQGIAEIEKQAFSCERKGGFCFMWWPKLPEIKGWHQDINNSKHYSINAQSLNGFTFSNSETVIYANAEYQHDKMPYKTLKDFINFSQSKFTKGSYLVEIEKSAEVKSDSGITFYSYMFKPKSEGNWEHVSYAEETDAKGNKYYLIFTLSSRTESGYKSYLEDYFKFIRHYI